ncbi:predicted protein [Sclerotinia sclerotiorum 1980 UF-70]|uniref:Hydrophobin n=2 Tax=Sclerotinia sclerotiorum (strain ATCC 18683 / 1980 / Ss-1) TaxID=665079 RepID=A0A1D9PY34_SCLS1|nr:predicted protein [Sclerotinia sclerotiorum 1980 UF-70]APA07509.1 hypothetical protein sscle_03g022790 [Sclerotinia sclerotiorum 1980 UF-70]EDN91600.1 predicted protein [Sclerotinia sclerotiorum 1980 UF-70]
MHFPSILILSSTVATLAAAIPSQISNDIEKRQSQFCTTVGFTNPFCCIPQLDVLNAVYVASECVQVPGGTSITSIQDFDSACLELNKIALCCNLNIEGIATCSEAVQH